MSKNDTKTPVTNSIDINSAQAKPIVSTARTNRILSSVQTNSIPNKVLPKLSQRLQLIADMVENSKVLIDVGTDHALIPISTVGTGRCEYSIAADIKEGPLKIAERNILKYKLQDRISTCLTDGLEGIEVGKNDTVVISGMGGYEIISILTGKAIHAKSLILQPQKSQMELREFLSHNGYQIRSEKIAMEDDKFYIVMDVFFTGVKYDITLVEKIAGPSILSDKPLYFSEYLSHLIDKTKKQVKGDSTLIEVVRELERMEQLNETN